MGDSALGSPDRLCQFRHGRSALQDQFEYLPAEGIRQRSEGCSICHRAVLLELGVGGRGIDRHC